MDTLQNCKTITNDDTCNVHREKKLLLLFTQYDVRLLFFLQSQSQSHKMGLQPIQM